MGITENRNTLNTLDGFLAKILIEEEGFSQLLSTLEFNGS